MLENKKLNMIISLLIAIALWAFVIGEVNPEASRIYREVPITFTNQEVLEEQGLAVYSCSDRFVNVTVTGNRSEINKIDSKDVVATVDLSNASLGENQLRVQLKVPGKAEVETQSITNVTVKVENRVSKDVEVEVFYEGDFTNGLEPITVEQSVTHVTISGAETNVSNVAIVQAVVEENQVAEEPSEIWCSLVAVDANGRTISGLSISQDEIMIISELAKLKTVPLIVPLIGADNNDIEREITVPDEITIKGHSADLDAIETITAEPVDLSDVVSNKRIPVIPILPDNVAVSKESGQLEVVVQVTKITSKTLTFDDADVKLLNIPEGMEALCENIVIKVKLTGSESVLKSIDKTKISLTADLSGFKTGRHKAVLIASCTLEAVTVEVQPTKMVVKLQAVEDNHPSDDDTVQQPEDDDTGQSGDGDEGNDNHEDKQENDEK